MASLLKIGTQVVLPSTRTDVFACASGKTTRVTIFFCNPDGGDTTFKLSLAIDGEADDPKQYLFSDCGIKANETQVVDDLWLNEGDVLRASSASEFVVCNVLVSESLDLARE